jgi:glycosyltransferase involved in cell wall biosynthesis
MSKIYYMSLESYEERYTLQLTEWNKRVFDRRKIDVVYVPGETLDNSKKIVVGQVLDAHGRSYFAMSQMMNLVRMMQQGEVTSQDVVYFEDMFQPGFESLGYIITQVPENLRPRIFVRCLAQTIDPDDFVHVWGMQKWMSDYERMVNEIVSISKGAVLASNEEMVAHMKVAGWTANIYNISGLAFGKQEVRERAGNNLVPFDQRKLRVCFASRWDQEKNPDFYLQLIKDWYARDDRMWYPEFAIFTGGTLRSNKQEFVDMARELESKGQLKIYENLAKDEYYRLLADSRVLINTALQDWTSNTVSEADALGCNVLFPAYRSFPEVFANDHERMYVPWSLEDLTMKLNNLLVTPYKNIGKISDWTDKTIDRICDIIEGNGEQWLRMSTDYRKHTKETKY